jgi:hypothetical protein
LEKIQQKAGLIMNQIWIEYLNRFKNGHQLQLAETFFTQYSLQDYAQKLPYLCNIETFCLRLGVALKNDQKICIYSDYDTDAVTATATMYWGLVELGFKSENLSFYAPDRFVEGYGMNLEAVTELAYQNDLIISVDCGINSVDEAKKILELKNGGQTECDLIITDHHHLVGEVPNCLAVINPRLAHYYNQNRLETRPNLALAKLDQLGLDLKDLERWVEKVYHSPQILTDQPEKFLSESVTGVGVAWFSLVWFGYFLEEVGLN